MSERELAVVDDGAIAVGKGTTYHMAMRLQEMREQVQLVHRFFQEVMVENQDYGVIPGTDKPTLLKPGAEKLCEFYGFAPTVREVQEDSDRETGYYRARVVLALVQRSTGQTVAEGVGEANTYEGRYRWRWVPDFKIPKDLDVSGFKADRRKNRNGEWYTSYRLENEDPWALWNTVLKMAKKRALVDAALSATRSSGLFTQDAEDLQQWVDRDVLEGEVVKPKDAPKSDWSAFWLEAKRLGFDPAAVHRLAGTDTLGNFSEAQRAQLLDRMREKAPPETPEWAEELFLLLKGNGLELADLAGPLGVRFVREDTYPEVVRAWLSVDKKRTIAGLVGQAREAKQG